MKNRKSLLALLLAAPLLLAPNTPVCPQCSIDEFEQEEYGAQVSSNVSYVVTLDVVSGSADLDVVGTLVSNLQCSVSGATETCTFDARDDGEVGLLVTGGSGGADFDLDIAW